LQTQLFSEDLPLGHQESWRNLFGFLLISAVGLCAILATCYLLEPHALQVINLKTTDIILGLQPKGKDSKRVVAVDIDEQSLKEFGQWPWPRYRIAKLLENLRELGAASIGINILFPEPDRISLENLQDVLKNDFDLHEDISTIIKSALDPDQILADTLARGPFVLGYSFRFTLPDMLEDSSCLLHPISATEAPTSSNLNFYIAKGVVCNYRPISEAISTSGFNNGTPDPDGVLRRLPLLISFKDKLYPSFALATLQQSLGFKELRLRKDWLGTTIFSIDGIELPVDEQANYLLGPVKSGKPDTISASKILKKTVAREAVVGKIVVVGTTAAGLSQYWPMPTGGDVPILELLRLTVEYMVTSNSTIRTRTMSYVEAGVTLSLALPVAAIIATLVPIWSTLCCLLLLLLVWFGTISIYLTTGYLFSPLMPSVAIVTMFALLHVLRFRQFQHRADENAAIANARLKIQEGNLHSILTAIPDIVYRLDKESRITYVSPAITKYLKDPDALIGQSIFDLVVPEDKEKAQYKLNERRTGKRATSNLEIRLKLATEDVPAAHGRYFSVSAEGIFAEKQSSEGGFVGTQGIVRDITDKKQLERQLVQAQKMEVVGNLAAGIAHDLNNILSGLVSYPDLLIMELPEDSPMREKIAIIQKSGRKAAAIVQDLLTLARRNIDIDELCNINTIVSDYLMSIEFQRVSARYPAITVRHNLQMEILNCRGSSVHLSKVLMNAIHNAMEAMPAGGEVEISTSMTQFVEPHIGYESIPPGVYVTLKIKDNGVGIPASELGLIFEPFYSKKSLDRSGTGLGMTIVWNTIKDHCGYLDIMSNEGMGTTLVIYVPASLEARIEEINRRIVLEDYVGSETLLIIDDDDDQRTITSSILAKLGYNVVTAASGEIGVEITQARTVDLVILDMVMQDGMDGLDTYRAMLAHNPNLKAVIISGYAETDRVLEVQKIGAGIFIQKPYSMEQLGMAIRAELDRSEKRSNS
jgi:PAS domain S-box-containing protein